MRCLHHYLLCCLLCCRIFDSTSYTIPSKEQAMFIFNKIGNMHSWHLTAAFRYIGVVCKNGKVGQLRILTEAHRNNNFPPWKQKHHLPDNRHDSLSEFSAPFFALLNCFAAPPPPSGGWGGEARTLMLVS